MYMDPGGTRESEERRRVTMAKGSTSLPWRDLEGER